MISNTVSLRRSHYLRSPLILAVLTACGVIFAQADDNIIRLQKRLKTEGCYFGNPTGLLDNATADALSRYQTSHNLLVTGKLDASTARSLHLSYPLPAPQPSPQSGPRVLTGSWRQLENGEMQFVEEQSATAPSPPAATRLPPASAPSPAAAQPQPPAEGPTVAIAGKSPPPSAPAPPSNGAQPPGPSPADDASGRLRDYVEAFVQAGLTRSPGSELKFFADQVNYFGAPNVPREQIQRDLVGYNQKWPHRTFWIDGDIQIQQQGSTIKLVFPLRYELRNGSRYASGKIMKSLTLVKSVNNEMQIVAVNEWKAP